MPKHRKTLFYWLSLAFIAIAFYPLFAFLGTLPLRLWDESRLAASAYEMLHTNNPLIVTFSYLPDHWSVKPPFLIWVQAISLKLFGVNEAAIRLPSALAILFMGIILIYYSSKLKKPFLGFYAAVVIICSKGLLYYHCGRNADYDAMLCFLIISYAIAFFVYLNNKEKKYYYLFFAFLILATLTKGVQALIPLPFLFIYTLFQKEFISLMKDKATYWGIGSFVLVIGGYYFGRELFDPGYLKAVYENELGGRYLTPLEGHKGGKDFYYKELKDGLFTYFFWLAPIAFVINLITKDKVIRNLNIYSFGIAAFIFLIVTIGQTKLTWYAFPIVPFLAIPIGISLYRLHLLINKIDNKLISSSLILIAFISFFYTPYKEIVQHVTLPKEPEWAKPYYSRFDLIRQVIKGDLVYKEGLTMIQNDNYQDHLFYKYAMDEKGIKNQVVWVKHLRVGDIVLVNTPEIDKEILERFEYECLYYHIQSKIIRLKQEKKKLIIN